MSWHGRPHRASRYHLQRISGIIVPLAVTITSQTINEANYGNDRADALANAEREDNSIVRMDEGNRQSPCSSRWSKASDPRSDASNMYDALLKIAHKESHRRTEASDYAKNKVEDTTSLRPTFTIECELTENEVLYIFGSPSNYLPIFEE